VDGRGKYLMPGLAEMHGHVPGQDAADYAEDVLFLYVSQGALTVRGMQGHPWHFELRGRVDSGELIGPRLYLSSPPMSGNSVPDAATAERLVREHEAAGYDLLKVHEGLSPAAYQAIARTATELDLMWGGHVPDAVGLDGALAAKQTTIDHLDNYIDAIERDDSPLRDAPPQQRARLPLYADAAKIPGVARRTREAGVAVVPTMALWEVLRGGHDAAAMRDRAELRYMPPQVVQSWIERVDRTRASVDPAIAAAEIRVRNQILKALHDEGAAILMGTDAPQVFSVPGFSLHREMQVMVDAGMTPYEVLRTGTVAVAEHFGTQAEAGTLAPGKHADLMLLDANPFDDIANAGRIAGVLIRGRWLPRAEIDRRLADIAARHGG
jgi:hypothetical protein